MYASVCVSIDAMLNVPLIGLRHKTQWEEANLRVGRFWVPNSFLKLYRNFEPISLVVRSMVIPWEDAIYMVPRRLQKLDGNSKKKKKKKPTPFVHIGDSIGGYEFNSYVFYVLTLIKIISILVLHTHHLFSFVP